MAKNLTTPPCDCAAGIPISQLPQAKPLDGTELFACVQNGQTRKTLVSGGGEIVITDGVQTDSELRTLVIGNGLVLNLGMGSDTQSDTVAFVPRVVGARIETNFGGSGLVVAGGALSFINFAGGSSSIAWNDSCTLTSSGITLPVPGYYAIGGMAQGVGGSSSAAFSLIITGTSTTTPFFNAAEDTIYAPPALAGQVLAETVIPCGAGDTIRAAIDNGGAGDVTIGSVALWAALVQTGPGTDTSGGGGETITTAGSVTQTTSGGSVTIQLVGDDSAPGASDYYGTDSTGAKGFFPLPPSGGGASTYTVTDGTNSDTASVGIYCDGLTVTSGGGSSADTVSLSPLLKSLQCWVQFFVAGGAISSFQGVNISSVVYNSVGNYTVNFTNPIPHTSAPLFSFSGGNGIYKVVSTLDPMGGSYYVLDVSGGFSSEADSVTILFLA